MHVEQTCVTLACDGCAKTFGDSDEGGSWHFDDLEAALKTAADCEWTVVEDGVACPECVAKALCESNGHDWTEWRRCLCGGDTPEHRDTGMTSEHRSCQRDQCHTYEQQKVVGDCEVGYRPAPLSDGARLIEHRRNWQLGVEANPERDFGPHEVPAGVEDLVRQGAEIAARIDAALPDGYRVR